MVRIDVPSCSRHLSRVQALPHATCSDTDPSQIEDGGKKSVRKYREVEKPQWPPTVTPSCLGVFLIVARLVHLLLISVIPKQLKLINTPSDSYIISQKFN